MTKGMGLNTIIFKEFPLFGSYLCQFCEYLIKYVAYIGKYVPNKVIWAHILMKFIELQSFSQFIKNKNKI